MTPGRGGGSGRGGVVTAVASRRALRLSRITHVDDLPDTFRLNRNGRWSCRPLKSDPFATCPHDVQLLPESEIPPPAAARPLSPVLDDTYFGLTRAEREQLARQRPSRYRTGVADDVWRNAQDSNGRVFDPNTGEELFWDRSRNRTGQWGMGHIKGRSYKDLRQQCLDGIICRKEFLDEYNNPANYRPEAMKPNRGQEYD